MENLQEAKAYTIEQAVEHYKNGVAIENDNRNLPLLRKILNDHVKGAYQYYYLLAYKAIWADKLPSYLKSIKLSQITELSEHPKEAESGEADGWIEIQNHKPKINQQVFMYFGHRAVIGTYKGESGFLCSEDGELWGIREEKITHWMPLPNPPKSNT